MNVVVDGHFGDVVTSHVDDSLGSGFFFHSGNSVFECYVFRNEAGYLFLLFGDLVVGVEEEVFFGEMFLRRTKELVVEGYSIVEVLTTILEEHIMALPCPETLSAFKHSHEDNEGDEHDLLVVSDRAIGKHIVLRLIAGAGGLEDIRVKEVRGVHHAHHGDLDRHIMGIEMALHGVQPVDVHLIFGEIMAQIPSGQSVMVIWLVVYVQLNIKITINSLSNLRN